MIEKKRAVKWCAATALIVCALTLLCVRFFGTHGKLSAVEGLIERVYVEDVDADVLLDGAARGLVQALGDPYSEYMTEDEYTQFLNDLNNSYTGIGVTVFLDPNDNKMTVLATIPGSPADGAGLLPLDKIVKIDELEVNDETYREAIGYLQKEERDITLTVEREGEVLTVDVLASEVDVPTVTEKEFGDIYYIGLSMFGEKTSGEVESALSRADGAKAVIIDLRNNGGGLVTSLCDVSELFLPPGLLFYSEDKAGNREDVFLENEEYFDKPLAVLINGHTASASEIFSGAVKDGSRGVLIGETTFGKGLVQNTYQLSDGSAVKLTTAKYYTPSGAYINEVGIAPDVPVPAGDSLVPTLDPATDPQLKKALELLGG